MGGGGGAGVKIPRTRYLELHPIFLTDRSISYQGRLKIMANILGIPMSPTGRGGGHIVFGVDPVCVGVSVGVSVGVGVILSCLHDTSWTGCRILTKFVWM